MAEKAKGKKKVDNGGTPPQQPKYTLFGGAIGYDSPSDYDKFMEGLDKTQALHMLVAAVNYAQVRGVYNLHEAGLLVASIKTFSPKQENVSNNEQPTQE